MQLTASPKPVRDVRDVDLFAPFFSIEALVRKKAAFTPECLTNPDGFGSKQPRTSTSYFCHPLITRKAPMNDHNKTTMKAYLASLAYQAPQPDATLAPVISAAGRRAQYEARLTPLPDRLRIALAKFPPELLAEGVHMSQLWPLVLGVQRSKPRAFEVAEALRAIGWTRVRYYSDSEPSTTLWFPPEVDAAEAKAILKARKG